MAQSGTRDPAPLLLLGLGSDVLADVIAPLVAAGLPVRLGTLADLSGGPWRLIISSPAMPGLGAMELLAALRASGDSVPPGLLLVGSAQQLARSAGTEDREAAAGQWQQLVWPFEPQQLVERVQAMLRAADAHPEKPAQAPALPAEPHLGLLDESRFMVLLASEREEQRRGRSPGASFVAALRLDELDRYRERLSPDILTLLWRQVAELAGLDALADEQLALSGAGDFLLLLPGASRRRAAWRLAQLSERIAAHRFDLHGQRTQFSPVIGYASLRRTADAGQAVAHAREAARQAALHLDLHPQLYRPGEPGGTSPLRSAAERCRRLLVRLRASRLYRSLWVQYGITLTAGVVAPFLVYWMLGRQGFDVSGPVYVFVVASLTMTALLIWAEGFLALRRVDPPTEPARPYPAASAVIAAYLPNEAPIIEDTVRAFLRVQYPAPLQIILAYNTPRDMPEVEERLRRIAREHPRFVPMRVPSSTSKAQNVNAAMPYVTGEFTAVFDADHQPDPDSFRRAWRWISHGADVVQGHCFIRNGEASWVARMVAVEFEQIYAVSHPGRARLHGFGIFGGSNGYWRTGLLRELRMHGFMLTEDIDSSMRAVVRGQRIVSDPYLISRELAPETLAALAKQRLRWAQGWFQISMKWVIPALRSPHLSLRQKLGMLHLLAWREVYPWISLQVVPLIAYWAVEAGSLARIDWFVPLFLVTTLVTFSSGPGQILFVRRLADPQIRKHPSWFWFYLGTSLFFYAGLKNAWGRIAHLKEVMGETTWVVTTRTRAKQ